MGGLRVKGVRATQIALRRTADRTSKAALRAVRAGAKKIQERAREYAPIDEGYLEESIQIEEIKGAKGRLEIRVGVDKDRLGEGYTRYGRRYDIIMHEGSYNLGPKSAAKAAATGMEVGPKYLTRAMRDYREEIRERIETSVKKGLY